MRITKNTIYDPITDRSMPVYMIIVRGNAIEMDPY